MTHHQSSLTTSYPIQDENLIINHKLNTHKRNQKLYFFPHIQLNFFSELFQNNVLLSCLAENKDLHSHQTIALNIPLDFLYLLNRPSVTEHRYEGVFESGLCCLMQD